MRAVPYMAFLLAILPTVAAGSVVARVDQTSVGRNARFVVTVEMRGGVLGDPEIPDVEGLVMDRYPMARSESLSFGSGQKMMRTKVLGFAATATKAGSIEIPPIGALVDGTMEYSEPIVLQVSEDAAASQRSRGSRSEPSRAKGSYTWDDLLFVTSEVDKTEVYQGEAVVLAFGIWTLEDQRVERTKETKEALDDANATATKGFYASPFSLEVETQESANGLPYRVSTYRKVLCPMTAGELTIGPLRWEGVVQYISSFFDRPRRELKLTTPETKINVKPLPPAPPEFGGAVGSFTLRAELARADVMQGVPTKLVVEVKGRGNPSAVGDPKFEKIQNAYVSDPERETEGDNAPDICKRFTYTITPLAPGETIVPEIRFCYFDTTQGAYVTQTQGPFVIRALPTSEQGSRVVLTETGLEKSRKVDLLGEDILPSVTNPGPLRPSRPRPFAMPALFMGPMLGYLGFALVLRRKRRFETDPEFARAHRARSRCRNGLRAVARSRDAEETLYRSLIGLVADKLGIEEAGLTSHDVQRLFDGRNMDPDLAEMCLKILRACERARYGGVPLSSDEMHALTHAALANLDRLDAALMKDYTR